MSGGGDTPTKTLWRFQGQGENMFGEYQDGNLSCEGPDEEGIFIADNEGKITSLQNFFPDQLKEIFEPYFGEIKNVQILVVTGLAIGDDVPNWDSYEIINP